MVLHYPHAVVAMLVEQKNVFCMNYSRYWYVSIVQWYAVFI